MEDRSPEGVLSCQRGQHSGAALPKRCLPKERNRSAGKQQENGRGLGRGAALRGKARLPGGTARVIPLPQRLQTPELGASPAAVPRGEAHAGAHGGWHRTQGRETGSRGESRMRKEELFHL